MIPWNLSDKRPVWNLRDQSIAAAQPASWYLVKTAPRRKSISCRASTASDMFSSTAPAVFTARRMSLPRCQLWAIAASHRGVRAENRARRYRMPGFTS